MLSTVLDAETHQSRFHTLVDATDMVGAPITMGPVLAAVTSLPALKSLGLSGTGSDLGNTSAIRTALPLLTEVQLTDMSFSLGGLFNTWLAIPALQRLSLRNLTLPSGTALPSEWGPGCPALQFLELSALKGIVGGVPASWVLGMPSLQTMAVQLTPSLNASLSDWATLVTSTPHATNLTSLTLYGLGLTGTISATMFNKSR